MAEPVRIPMWLALGGGITTSGQPDAAQLTALRDSGVRHIVNLAPQSHARALSDEAEIVAALGMDYTHIPVAFDDPSERDFDAFCATMDALEGERVHVHCIVNARVSAFLHRRRVERQGMAPAESRAIMERIWRPGGVWATFVGDPYGATLPHRYAGADY